MKYKTLLFDVDDTLLDFQATEKAALRQLFAAEGLELTVDLERCYKKMNLELWQSFERGECSRDELVYQRFGHFFGQLGQTVDSVKLENQYRSFLNQGHHLLGNSLAIIKDLSRKADLFVVTNGVSKTQYQRLGDAKLLPYFKNVFVSEDTGYQKPMKEYFDYVFERIPNLDLAKTVIIGDSLTSDIQGGVAAGIDTIWLNNQKESSQSTIHSTYEIQQLDEIYPIIDC